MNKDTNGWWSLSSSRYLSNTERKRIAERIKEGYIQGKIFLEEEANICENCGAELVDGTTMNPHHWTGNEQGLCCDCFFQHPTCAECKERKKTAWLPKKKS